MVMRRKRSRILNLRKNQMIDVAPVDVRLVFFYWEKEKKDGKI